MMNIGRFTKVEKQPDPSYFFIKKNYQEILVQAALATLFTIFLLKKSKYIIILK